jgi:hypothetical protein
MPISYTEIDRTDLSGGVKEKALQKKEKPWEKY